MSVWPLPRITFRDLNSIEEKRPVALLTTTEAWTALNDQLNLPVLIQAEPARYDRDLFDFLADNLPSQAGAVYVIGQGAPLIAARNRVPLVVVPTALDSAMLLTPTALVDESEDDQVRRRVVPAVPADDVIIDWRLIQDARPKVRGTGIVDVLSIVTGLLDWRFAAQHGKNPRTERFTPWAASVMTGLAKQALKSASAIGQGNREDLEILLHLMVTAVQVSNQLGHTRTWQGGEHYLAQVLSTRDAAELTHAERVGPCMLFLSALHGQSPDPLRDALLQAGVELDQLNPVDVQLVLGRLPALLEEYGFPYSILNTLDPEAEAVRAALETAGLAVEVDTWEQPPREVWEVMDPGPRVEAPHEDKVPLDAVSEDQTRPADQTSPLADD
jgi:glycerol dehydrogenase-like iron-containing ADH family enzyme